ncbi:THO complex subunit 5B-like [Telopea speciosissima]|uniref:THO complex subunit 5B-like n=1 Tax=Telopea speciosissima TaxID=54955 RepID=UPI001CC590C7|nr:THO complex subunit 5B-like [Telopea speciosissima]
MEEEMAEALPARKMEKKAYEQLEESRTSMEEIVAKMLFVKKEGKPKSELRELVTQMSLHFVNLRQINRSILLEEDRVKAETERAKPPVDFTTLQLHNLLYEKNHYLKAIKACKDFKSKHPDIELVPEEEFFSSGPEDIKGTVMSNDSSHNLMLQRLNFELFQRKELCKLHEKLEQHKKNLLETIANRKKFLSSLPSHLKSLKKASLPVQHQLGVLHTKKLKQHHSAELLPPPLYVIYSQLLAQKEAFGENVDMEIVGSMKDAQAFAHQQATKDAGTSTNTDTYRLEDDAPDEDDDGQRRRKRPKKVPGRESLEQAGIYQSHPLKIILHIYDEEVSESKPSKLISLKFEYLLKLNVVCVGIEGSHEGPETNILCNLFPNDAGIELPHQSAKLIAGDAVTFDEKRISCPYTWAQHLAGIDFLPEASPLLTSSEIPSSETVKSASVISGLSLYRQQNRVHTVVQRIRSRKKAQMALAVQLDFLMKLKWPPLTYENVPWASHNPLCNLQSWSSVGPSPHQVSSLPAVALEQVAEPLDLDTEGRSGTLREEMESAREDGELPAVVQVPTIINDTKLPDAKTPVSKVTDVEHSRRLILLSKSVVPTFKKTKSLSFQKIDEDLELTLDDESDLDEASQFEREPESAANIGCHKMVSWEDYGVKEFCLVLNRKIGKTERAINLEAKVKISMEYPLRPPVFTLALYSALPGESSYERNDSEWFNELRAMEAEVNLHILKMLPCDYENNILAHQVCCLVMLFDFFMDEESPCSQTRKGTSVVDVGLCKPVSGTMLSRSFRGRDRRKMVSWKDAQCTLGYPC